MQRCLRKCAFRFVDAKLNIKRSESAGANEHLLADVAGFVLLTFLRIYNTCAHIQPSLIVLWCRLDLLWVKLIC